MEWVIRNLYGITVVCIAGVVLIGAYLMRREAGQHRDRPGSGRGQP